MAQKTSYEISSSKINHVFIVNETANCNGNEANGPTHETKPERQQWGNKREFLLSCIAMSVGLGNVWRFPFTAYENGGGAFLIPYIIVLFIVGKPLYLFEMILGQFSSSSAVKIWELAPALRGIGVAQFITLLPLASYYCSLMALTLFYLVASFQRELPWSRCREEWSDFCVDSTRENNSIKLVGGNVSYVSSAELYFYKEVLHETDNVDDGIGMPDWRLVIGLFVSWLIIFFVVIRGVRSSGKAAYFLAIFPYVVLVVLLVRACTTNGSVTGILYFITPSWEKLLTPTIWYHAVAQCFYSLTVCFGAVVMFASHNQFHHDLYRDATIVTILDTFTSLLAGFTIFATLGNLSYELDTDISTVVRGGVGLAFISYPETIAKFTIAPQFFSVIFFSMLFVLGIGSEVGLASAIISIVRDQFPKAKYWHVAAGICFFEFLIGLIYITPGGQFMITFVDYYVTSFITFLPAVVEMIGVTWLYGLGNFLNDVEFMLKRRLSIYWQICWSVVTPVIIFAIFVYTLINLEPLKYNNTFYPDMVYVFGWILFSFAVLQLPLWIGIAIFKKRHLPFRKMISQAFRPSESWGPNNTEDRINWLAFRHQRDMQDNNGNMDLGGAFRRLLRMIFRR